MHYLRDLANAFHTYYNAEQFIVEDAAVRDARLALALADPAGDPQRPYPARRILAGEPCERRSRDAN